MSQFRNSVPEKVMYLGLYWKRGKGGLRLLCIWKLMHFTFWQSCAAWCSTYSEVNSTEINGIYSHVSVHKPAAIIYVSDSLSLRRLESPAEQEKEARYLCSAYLFTGSSDSGHVGLCETYSCGNNSERGRGKVLQEIYLPIYIKMQHSEQDKIAC